MPVQATYDVLNEPPRAVGCRFELAARRLTEAWLAAGQLDVSAEVLALVVEFLERSGLVVEAVTGGQVRLRSERGRTTVLTREAALVRALRCLAARDARHAHAFLAPCAA